MKIMSDNEEEKGVLLHQSNVKRDALGKVS